MLLHRFILGAQKGQLVDHEDRNGLNCQKNNIRIATHAQNMQNRRGNAGSESGYKGVYRITRQGLGDAWQPRIKVGDKEEYLDYCGSPEEAALLYNRRAVELFGSFAFQNVVTVPANAPACVRRKRTSQHIGVSYHPTNGKYRRSKPWFAQVRMNGRNYHIGYFATEDEAAVAHAAKVSVLRRAAVVSRSAMVTA
jgi:hypothetical protein